jgi:HAD superfamily hydrolase (TIGR01509 family)
MTNGVVARRELTSSTMKADLKALIFDVDGTLAETERDGHRVAFNRAFHDVGLDWDWSQEFYAGLLGVTGGKERIRHYIDHYTTGFEPSNDLDTFVGDLHKLKTRHYLALLNAGAIPLRPGIARLLQEARDVGLDLAIATTTSPENVTTLLKTSLDKAAPGWFKVIAAGDMVPEKKPAPDIYLYVMHRLRLTAEQCIAIEDSRNGLLAAHAANIETIITVNGYSRQQDFAGALLVVDQIGEPTRPFKVLQGEVKEARYLTVGVIRQLLQQRF